MIIEFQHFHGCPNSTPLLKRVKEAINRFPDKIEFVETVIDSHEKAVQIGFRGSPTVLIDGEDLEGMEMPDSPSLSCRLYTVGLPSVTAIVAAIRK